MAQDPDILDMVAASPPSQQNPTLLFACVHDLLLSGHEHPLARYYPTVTTEGAWPPSEGDPFVEFASFCREHRRALTELLATRSTQTNEVGRSAVLLPALHAVAARHSRPLAIADLGASAGLNLLFDRYAYDYGTTCAGDPASAVRIECEVRQGTLPDLSRALTAPFRTGIDLHPMDLDDDGDCRWLLACQWPDHPDRFARLDAAIHLARCAPERPRVVVGDMVEDLERLTDGAPADAQLCVLHTWVAAYLSPDQQHASSAPCSPASRGGVRSRGSSPSWPTWCRVFPQHPLRGPGCRGRHRTGSGRVR